MLKVVNSLEPWVFSELLHFLEENIQELPVFQAYDMHKTQAYYDELISFFQQDHGMLFLWEEQGTFVSACRIEADQDRCLLHDLATKPSERQKGYGRKLLLATIDYLKDQRIRSICVHVKKNNIPSISLHSSVGFVKVKDSAHLLDGTVSSAYITMEYVVK